MIYGIAAGTVEAALIMGVWKHYGIVRFRSGEGTGKTGIQLWTILLSAGVLVSAVFMNILMWKKQYRPVTYGNLIQVFVILAIAAGIDYRKHLIPNRVLAVGMLNRGLLLVAEGIWYPEEVGRTCIVSAVGLVFCTLFMLLLVFLTRNGIGYGDVKLLAWLGFSLGLMDTYYVLFYAVLFTAVAGIFLLLVKKADRKKQLPFAPFVFMGNYLVFVMMFLQ